MTTSPSFSPTSLSRDAGLGDDAGAETLFRRALVAAQVHDHRLIAPIQTDLADLLCSKGRFEEAMALLEQAGHSCAERYPDQAGDPPGSTILAAHAWFARATMLGVS